METKPKTIITQWVHPEIIEFLSPVTQIIANPDKEVWPKEKIIALAQDAQAMMVFMPDRVDDAFLACCPDLKIVSAALKGYDNFDVAACTRRGIWFSMVPDLLTIPTAELALGLLIGLARNIRHGDHRVRSGNFKGWRPVLYGRGLDHATTGIIGMGAVGQAISRQLSGFNTRILYTDPVSVSPDLFPMNPPEQVELGTLLTQSDFIIVATPYSTGTRHLINAETLSRIKPHALLINIGRGSCVDEAAVFLALAEDRLGGYGADVFEFEDWARPDRPNSIPRALLEAKNTLFTPHLGSAVDDVRYQIAMEAAVSIKDVLEGRPPRGAVNRV